MIAVWLSGMRTIDVFSVTQRCSSQPIRVAVAEATVIRVDHSGALEGFAAVSEDFTLQFESNRDTFCVSSAGKICRGVSSD